MVDAWALPAVLLLPAMGALVVALIGSRTLARVCTMLVMLVVLAAALHIVNGHDGAAAASRYAVDLPWMPALGVGLRFAVDGLNVYLLLLTALLFPVVLACAWSGAEAQSRLYLSLLLALQAALLGTFLTQNLVLFFVFWEAVLIPGALMILVFGGPRRRAAAVTFFLYTMAGSVLLLAAVILLGAEGLAQTGRWSFDFDELAQLRLSGGKQTFVFCAIALACAVKSPLFPFHSWLPLAYGEASTPTTALLSGVLSKMGAYGLLKLALPLAPQVAPRMAPVMVMLAVVSILYGAVLALRQTHYKQLVAYASLSHMGYIVLGIFSFQATAVHGAMVQIVAHGLSVAGLFLVLALLEQRCGPAYLQQQALAGRTPRMAVLLMLFVLASLALPLSSGFTAEFLVLLGAFTQGLAAWHTGGGVWLLAWALLASTAVVLGASYMLRFARVLVFGRAGSAPKVADLGVRETVALAALVVPILWLGIAPAALMAKVEPAVARLSALGAIPLEPAQPAAPRTAALGGGLTVSPAEPAQESRHDR